MSLAEKLQPTCLHTKRLVSIFEIIKKKSEKIIESSSHPVLMRRAFVEGLSDLLQKGTGRTRENASHVSRMVYGLENTPSSRLESAMAAHDVIKMYDEVHAFMSAFRPDMDVWYEQTQQSNYRSGWDDAPTSAG